MSDKPIKISIILPVYSETNSLVDTVREINNVVPSEYLYEILIIVSPKSASESFDICKRLSLQYSFINWHTQQNNPGIGWAFREAFVKAKGTHILMMASDGETDPKAIPLMIKKSEETGCDIVIGNRWSRNGGFKRYNPVKFVLNYLFQSILKTIFIPTIDDYTYAYRLYKTEALKGSCWEETKHPFLLESLLKPIKRGFSVEQVAVKWSSRNSGKPKNTFFQNFAYIRTAIRVYLKNEGAK